MTRNRQTIALLLMQRHPAALPPRPRGDRMTTLSVAQDHALRLLSEPDEGEGFWQSHAGSANWYTPQHEPGDPYIDNHTAEALIAVGLAEIHDGALRRTEAGTAHAAASRKR